MGPKELEQNQNEDAMKLLVSRMNHRLARINEGGGAKRIAKLHSQGKMTARERIETLLDPGAPVVEIGAFAGYDMYAEHGGCPAGGVVVVLGFVSGRQCVVVANDATVKAGAWFPITGKKNLRAQEIATACLLFTSWIVLGYICRCRTKFFRIRNTLAAFSGIMRVCPAWVLPKLQPSWAVVWQAARICPSCPMKR